MKKKFALLTSLLLLALSSCGGAPCSSISSNDSDGVTSGGSSPSSSSSSSSSSSQEQKFVINGIEDVSSLAGFYFDPFAGVTCLAASGKDISNEIKVSGGVNYAVPGIYTLEYSLSNFSAKRKVTILENEDLGAVEKPYIYTAKNDYCISRGQKVTAEEKDSSVPASNLTDGDLSTRYESPWSEGPYDVLLDLGAVLSFSRVELNWENASAKRYELFSSSDGVSFVKVLSKDDGIYGSHQDAMEVSGSGRYIKLSLLERTTNYGYSLYEFSVYGKQGLPVPYDEYPHLYESQVIEDEQTLDIAFGVKTKFDKVELTYYGWLAPTDFELLVSDDGKEYVSEGRYQNGESSLSVGELSCSFARFRFHSRAFCSKNYKISLLRFSLAGTELSLNDASISSSTSDGDNLPQNARGDYNTYWGSEVSSECSLGQIVDLGTSKNVGRVDLRWQKNYGKVYDVFLLDSLEDIEKATPVYRELRGAKEAVSLFLYRSGRYLVIKDYSNNSADRFRLLAITVNSLIPSETAGDYEIGSLPNKTINRTGKASYLSGAPEELETARGIGYASDDLTGAIDSNSWWNSLLINNFGNANYLNPLRAKYSSNGLGISYPEEGYFETTYKRSQVVTETTDLTIAPTDIVSSPETKVLGYDDFGVKVSFSDALINKMTNLLYQGSPFIYSYFSTQKATIFIDSTSNVLDLQGNQLNESYTGSSVVIHVKSFVSYVGGVANTGAQKEYRDHYYLVSAPKESSFSFSSGKISVSLSGGNYLSVGLLPSLDETSNFLESAYSFIEKGTCSYSVSGTGEVATTYSYQSVSHEGDGHNVIALLSHQWRKFDAAYLPSTYNSIRGKMKIYPSGTFSTLDNFPSIVSSFSEPEDDTYNRDEMLSSLEDYDERTKGDNLSADAYWEGKAIHPLANAIYEANSLGEITLRDSFIKKLRKIYDEWFTYGGPGDQEYFYYDSTWGTLYYPVSEFGANFNLADHHFTYGYYALGAACLAEFDPSFQKDYGSMMELLVLDYMNYTNDESDFCRFRNYDFYAGHSWAGGYSDSDGGNNQESAGEALNSWASAYYYADAISNGEMRDAAIFGYTTELAAIKEYWFNYEGGAYSDSYPYAGVGQIYGGSNFYGTFFNGDPTYIYGIQWLPSGEYLSGYAIGEAERKKLLALYEAYLEEEKTWTGHEGEDGYQHIFYVILAFADSGEALEKLNANKETLKTNNEFFNVYYLIHSLATFGTKNGELRISGGQGALYKKDGVTKAIIHNPTSKDKTISFYREGAVVGSAAIEAGETATVDPFSNTQWRHSLTPTNPQNPNSASKTLIEGTKIRYSFSYLFAPGEYRFKINAINETASDCQIRVLDDKGNVLYLLTAPKDENSNLTSDNSLSMRGRKNIVIEVAEDIYIPSFYFIEC